MLNKKKDNFCFVMKWGLTINIKSTVPTRVYACLFLMRAFSHGDMGIDSLSEQSLNGW